MIIQRFELAIEPRQKLQIPFNSEIIRFGMFNNKPCLWVIIDPGQRLQDRSFAIIADGKEISLNRTQYIGSFETKAEVGHHVVHVFEV